MGKRKQKDSRTSWHVWRGEWNTGNCIDLDNSNCHLRSQVGSGNEINVKDVLTINFCFNIALCREENTLFSSKQTYMQLHIVFICHHPESMWPDLIWPFLGEKREKITWEWGYSVCEKYFLVSIGVRYKPFQPITQCMMYCSILPNCLYSFLVNRLGEFCFSSQLSCCEWSFAFFLLPNNLFSADNIRRLCWKFLYGSKERVWKLCRAWHFQLFFSFYILCIK